MKWIWMLSVPIVLLCAGCCCVPPILFPRTGAHGVVLDEDNHPIPNAQLEAQWYTVRFSSMLALPIVLPTYSTKFSTDNDGKWFFYERKVDSMSIVILPREGYERQADAYAVDLRGGQCPTNDFILRLRKIGPTTNAVPVIKSEAK